MTRRDILLAFVPPLCWGTGITFAKSAVAHFPPLFLMTLIYAAIALVLLITARDGIKTDWKRLSLIAAFSVTIQGALIFWGLQELSATAAVLIVQIQVPFAVILGWLVGAEELSPRKLAGTLIAIAGVAAVIGLPEEIPPLLPAAAIVAGAFAWALGQVLAAKFGRDGGILLLKGNALAALPQLILATLALETGQIAAVTSATAADWLAFAYLAAVGFYIAYAVWFSLLRRCRVDEVVPFTLLMPVVGLVTAALMLGERIAPAQVLGAAVIVLGLAIVVGLKLPRLKPA